MKKLILFSLLATSAFAQFPTGVQEATAAQVVAGLAGPPYVLTPRRLSSIVVSTPINLGITGSASPAANSASLSLASGQSVTLSGTAAALSFSGSPTFTVSGSTTITGGGTITLGGFNLTVPATGTVGLLGTAQTWSGANTYSSTVSHSGLVKITDSTASTGTTSGALVVTGGVGVQGSVFSANVSTGTITFSGMVSSTQSANSTYPFLTFVNGNTGASAIAAAYLVYNNAGKRMEAGIYGSNNDAGQSYLYTDAPKLVLWANNAQTFTLSNTAATLSATLTVSAITSSGAINTSGGLGTGGATSFSSASVYLPGIANSVGANYVEVGTGGILTYQAIASDPRLKDITGRIPYGLKELVAAVNDTSGPGGTGATIDFNWKPGKGNFAGYPHEVGVNAAILKKHAPLTVKEAADEDKTLVPELRAIAGWQMQATSDLAAETRRNFWLLVAALAVSLSALFRTFRRLA